MIIIIIDLVAIVVVLEVWRSNFWIGGIALGAVRLLLVLMLQEPYSALTAPDGFGGIWRSNFWIGGSALEAVRLLLVLVFQGQYSALRAPGGFGEIKTAIRQR